MEGDFTKMDYTKEYTRRRANMLEHSQKVTVVVKYGGRLRGKSITG